jgi:bifunctional NMN adenylyltransferase/nudix hydrolase
MRLQEDSYDVGVIVGRFQVPELHDAHKDLIETVCDKHDKVIIFLGLSPLMVTRENPLDFESRKQMILESSPM